MLKEHKKIAQSPRKLARHITRQYVLALMLLAMLTLSTNVILNRLIESQRYHAELSELASTQRILFQEAGIMVGRLVKEARSAADNNLLLDTVRRNLTQIVAELKATHERLESIAKTFRASPFPPDMAKARRWPMPGNSSCMRRWAVRFWGSRWAGRFSG